MGTRDTLSWIRIIFKLQDVVPQSVSGSLPIIATVGAALDHGLIRKLLWILRCFGCPFVALFYFCNIKNDETMVAYWLTSDSFVKNGIVVPYRPFGHHAMELLLTSEQVILMRGCIAEAPILDRFSSLASAYYLFAGIVIGIIRVSVSCVNGDWPFISLALAWTLPAIYVRIFGGKVVIKDPKKLLQNDRIMVRELDSDTLNVQKVYVGLTAAFSIVIPWVSVIIAYFSIPIGFGCRSKFLTVLCFIWTFNSFVAYIFHIKGEKSVSGNKFINGWFIVCGVIVEAIMVFLGLLSGEPSWWSLFGEDCILNSCELEI